MKSDQAVTILVSALLAAMGWLIGYFTTIQRDRLSKRRDLRTQNLLDAYRRLEGAGNRREASADFAKALESAVADIQLLGSAEQVHLARRFALEFASEGKASLDLLLESLRRELRMELSLPSLNEPVTFLRIVRGPDGQSGDQSV
jgi:hypothetical protein